MLKWIIDKAEADLKELDELRKFKADVIAQCEPLAKVLAEEPESKGPGTSIFQAAIAVIVRQRRKLMKPPDLKVAETGEGA